MSSSAARILVTAAAIWTALPATAQEALDTIEVVGTTPIPGAVVPRSAVPANVQTVTSEDIAQQRPATLADFFNQNFSGAYVNEAQSNPYQPDLNYRGFVASPLLGNPIGLSVYVDGVRVNESFGDTVLWDLIPSVAIRSTDLVPGSNPVFGLNTLGGALNIRLHSGLTSPGGLVTLEGGSFGRRNLQASYGMGGDKVDFYISGEAIEEDGWRARSGTEIRRIFGKLGLSSDKSELSVSYTHADNSLTGNGLMPLSLLAVEPEGVYTYPDVSEPRLSFLNASFTRYLSDAVSVTANAYRRRLKLATLNGDAEFEDGDTPADPSDDEYEAEFRTTATDQTTTGLGLQLVRDDNIGSKRHRLAVGIGLDRGRSRFQQSEQEGEFTADRGVEGEGDIELDTDVSGRTTYQSIYLTDTITLSNRADFTVSGRYTRARVEIADQSGEEPDLNGDHSFGRFTPSFGMTYKATDSLSVYGGFNEGFRAPTPVELTCADPDDPCALPVAFVADPPLEPVVARTIELGVRTSRTKGLRWNAGFFFTNLKDDILFTSTGASQGFFANVPRTRRTGFELGVSADAGVFDWFANYSYTRATYESNVALFNPVASTSDPSQPETLSVQKGDRLPGVPDHLLKAGLRYKPADHWSVGLTMNLVGGQFLRGDESNQAPKLSGYSLFNLRAEYELASGWRLFGKIDNLFDKKYASLGAFNRIAFDANSEPLEGVGPGPVERFVSPGAPRSFWLGVEYRFGGK